MNKLRIPMVTILVLLTTSSAVIAGTSASKKKSASITISESKDGDELAIAVSKALARSLVEGVVGAELECGAELDSDVAAVLRELDRAGRGARAVIRHDDGVITARRSGRSLELEFDDTDDDGGLEIKMPWAVAECLLDGSATLKAKDARSIKVKLIGAEGGSFEFAVK